MLTFDEKRQNAPPDWVVAVDLISECVGSVSRRVSNPQLNNLIEKTLSQNNITPTCIIRFTINDKAVNVYDDDGLEYDPEHAHVAIDQANGEAYYWRNRGEARKQPSNWKYYCS